MAKSSQQIEQEFIRDVKSISGRDLKTWLSVIQKTGLTKRNEIVSWLKDQHSFGHVNASLLVGIYLNDGKPVYADSDDLLSAQFEKKEELRPLFNKLVGDTLKAVKGSEVTVKKTYISLHGQREFAAINIKSKEIRLAMDLGNVPFDGNLQKSKLTGPMPRISHMVVITVAGDISKKVLDLLKQANQRVNGSL
jgi:hypothetical protein